MKTYLLPPTGRFYKVNLHAHSTVSDGANTPAEMKAYYKAHGYHALALTDHELLVDHSDLNDPDFVMLTGYEYAFCEFGEQSLKDAATYRRSRTIELNIYPRDPHQVTQVCFDPRYVIHGEKYRAATLPRIGPAFERAYTTECIQQVIDAARANNCIVSLNHPAYSFESPAFFGCLKGLFGMEIHNQGSYYAFHDYNVQMYEEMLRMGHQLACIAADDNHRAYVYDDRDDPRPWGYTMIKAEQLSHEALIAAMERGDMYATQGPEIGELYLEDGMLHIACSEAKTIIMTSRWRIRGAETAPVGESLTHAAFPLPTPENGYVRFIVVDAYGRRAETRGYPLADLAAPKA